MAARTVTITGNMSTPDMGTEMTATPAEHLLILQNWFSPAFPVGAFSYSGGLETAIARGDVHDRDSLTDWLTITVPYGTSFTDAVFLRAAMDGADVNDRCCALCGGAERYQETMELGAAFTKVLAATDAIMLPAGLAYPVAIGMAAGRLGLDTRMTLAAFLQAACLNQISVAVRAVPIGQIDGQTCLAALMPVIEQTVARALTTDIDAIGSFTPAADLCRLNMKLRSNGFIAHDYRECRRQAETWASPRWYRRSGWCRQDKPDRGAVPCTVGPCLDGGHHQ